MTQNPGQQLDIGPTGCKSLCVSPGHAVNMKHRTNGCPVCMSGTCPGLVKLSWATIQDCLWNWPSLDLHQVKQEQDCSQLTNHDKA